MLDLLSSGIYELPEVADLVGATPARVRIWVAGRKGLQDPVIENELGRIGKKNAVSFTNLMELRFVAYFSYAGVRLNEIRSIMTEVKHTLEHPHPFATNIVFKTDGKKIVAQIGRRHGISSIYDLKSKNYEMPVIVMDTLKDGVIFDPKGDAAAWHPRPKTAPHVLIRPDLSFGRPVLETSFIPTETLSSAVKAEGSTKVVALLFDVPERLVQEAVAFENSLRQAA